MGDRTIEEMFDRVWDDFPKGYDDGPAPAAYVVALHAATTDRPVFSADGSLAVHRTDPELADELLDCCPTHRCGACPPCRAAALLAAPAAADPEAS